MKTMRFLVRVCVYGSGSSRPLIWTNHRPNKNAKKNTGSRNESAQFCINLNMYNNLKLNNPILMHCFKNLYGMYTQVCRVICM